MKDGGVKVAEEQSNYLDNNTAQSYFEAGGLAIKRQKLSDAIKYLKKASICEELKEQQKSDTYNMLGLCYYRLGEWEGAEKFWKQSVEIMPDEDNRAYKYLEELESKGALAYKQVYENALMHIKQGKYGKVSREIIRYSKGNIMTVRLWNILGLCEWKVGRNKNAYSCFKNALQKDVSHPITLRYLRELSASQG